MQIRGRIFASAILALAMSCSGTIDTGEDSDINAGGPEGNDPGTEVVSAYKQQMVAMQFTSVGCVNCPVLATSIKNIQKNMPGVIIPVSFHLDILDRCSQHRTIDATYRSKLHGHHLLLIG